MLENKIMEFYPPSKPYKHGHFPVSEKHSLYYELHGNPKGVPVLFVHGGPGAGCDSKSPRYFNPKKFNIIVVDQRGANRSKPYGSVKENTTQDLIDDFKKLLDAHNIKKTYLFGGSWGSTLSLCFAIQNPERVSGMVLRGIWYGGDLTTDYMLSGEGKSHFPEVWERFVGNVKNKKHPAIEYYEKIFSSNKKEATRFAQEWSRYEHALLHLEHDPNVLEKEMKSPSILALSRIEAHYFKHGCFLPKDYIMKNLNKIKNIPLSIVHGRYDFICKPENAYKLHKALPKSKLLFVTAGHSGSDPNVRSTMMHEIHNMVLRKNLK